MSENRPSLEVGFDIVTGGSMGELGQLETAMYATEGAVLNSAGRIERGTADMVDTKRAVSGLNAVGAAAKRELGAATQAVEGLARANNVINFDTAAASIRVMGTEARALARDKALTEKAGEALIRQLDRETAAIGQTKEAMRDAKIEALALRATQQGNSDLADRLLVSARANSAAIASRAEDEAEAARKVALAQDQVAQANRSAALSSAMFEAHARKMSQAARDAADAEASLAREAYQVRAALDPMFAAQQKFDAELERADRLLAAGVLKQREYAQEVQRSRDALYAHAQSVTGAASGAGKLKDATEQLGVVQRFTAAETLNLSRQFQDIGVTAAMGMNPLMILVQQGPQIYDVLEQAKARGVGAGAALKQMGMDAANYGAVGFGKLAALVTPANIAIAGTAVAAIAVARAIGSYGEAIERFEVTATGLGRTSGQTAEQLEAISEAAAAMGQRSLGAARDSVAAFASAGIQNSNTLAMLAADVDRYAKLTGQDVPAAQAALAEAIKDPARAADTFTQQLGLLTGAQYEHIRQLAAMGEGERAAAELTRILTHDLKANSAETTGLAHYMDVLGGAVAGVSTMFGRLDQRIQAAGASYDAWLKKNVGGWAIDLIGTGNKQAAGPNPNAGRNQDQVAALNASQSLNTTGMRQFNELVAQQRVLQKGLADTTGLTGAQIKALRHDYAAVTDTINANRTASGAWITTQERAHLIAQAQAKLAGARTQTEKAAAQRQITRLQTGSQVLTMQERETQAMDAYNKVSDKYHKPKVDHRAENLAREAEAIEAQIKNLYKLSDAYAVSGSASLVAEARVKAETDAIKKRGDVEAFVDRQIRLSVAERVRSAAQGTAGMRDQAMMQEQVNREVAAGIIPAQQAADLIRDRLADLPLLNALEAARTLKGKEGAQAVAATTAALEAQRGERERLTKAERDGQLVAAIKGGEDQLAILREELRLVGATEEVRVRSLATLRAEQEARNRNWNGTQAKDFVDGQVAIAVNTAKLARAQRLYNEQLTWTADRWDLIASNIANAGRGMADAFGEAGRAIGDIASIYASFEANRTRLEAERKRSLFDAAGNEKDIARANERFALSSATAQIGAFGDMTAAAKGFFDEKSKGYKALATAEKVYRAVEFALSVKSIAQDAAETVSSIFNSSARATAAGAEGIANQSKLPFPANIAAMAATGAALVAAGIAVAGGFGGGKNTLPKANDGTGTVLGDTSAKSESIKRAIDGLKDIDTLMLSSSREMAATLRSIDGQIGNVAALVVRAGDVNASASVSEGFKTNAVGSVLKAIVPVFGGALASLFGTKTTVVGSGLSAGPQTLGSVLDGGFDASYYSDVQKKKKFLGITTGTSYSTKYSAADAGIENQFTLILKGFNSAIAAAAGPLGETTDTIQRRLNGFVVNLGKIDLQGLTGEEIEEKLSAVFGAAADKMALAAFPGFERFQKVGEGAFETLVRIASTVEAVTASLDMLGGAARGIGIDAKLGLSEQFDSIGDFTSAANAYFETYYTAAEQNAAKVSQLSGVFVRLGTTMPETLAGFRALVDAQDLTTASGQTTYATLLQLAPAFADLKKEMEGAKSAADILAERQDLQRKILELNGDTAAIRALDLAKIDVSNRALQEQVWAISDAQEAAKNAQTLADAWSTVGNSIEDEIRRIRGLSDATGSTSFASAFSAFNAATASARAGDQDAAKLLPSLSQALLKVAGDSATSRQELDRVQAQTAASLEATSAVIAALAKGNPLTGAGTIAAAAVAAQAAAPAASVANDAAAPVAALRDEVAAMRADLNSALATIAGNTGRVAKKLEDVTAESGGDAIKVEAA